ncbi:hypothetical protein BV25DRAFT_1817762 [Artomyces pyxidatus]|uniref:Uncharacterized protein n=1 Tax=Artomyces pyxidatus TaxID=48021 RepID=A0ACB8TK76_9AGAM|nr:hypothetical protein BV25DRAFT_1817762 [Artomyces pyxidatus]
MSELKKRTTSRKLKTKPTLTGQKSILDHFQSTIKTSDPPQDLGEVVKEAISDPVSSVEERTVPDVFDNSRPFVSHSAPVTRSHTLADQSNSPNLVEIEPVAPLPPKRLFPLFEKTDHSVPPSTKPVARGSLKRKPTKVDASLYLNDGSSLPASQPSTSSRPTVSDALAATHTISRFVDLTVDEGSAQTPIVIDASPIRLRARPIRSATIQGLSLPGVAQTIPLKTRKPRKEKGDAEVPYPSNAAQHVRGPQVHCLPSEIGFPRRNKGKAVARDTDSVPSNLDFLKTPPNPSYSADEACDPSSSSPVDGPSNMDPVSAIRIDHPAFTRFVNHPPSSSADESSQQAWNEKWRPRRADQVLGNDESAVYLRDWMHALRLHYDKPPTPSNNSSQSSQGSQKRKSRSQPKLSQRRGVGKRPEIVREVERPRKRRRGELDWMVEDDEPVEHLMDSDEEIDRFADKISNTILLTGPPGSGKTAAVYACAEELGWNVFEVYPGIGKRGGTSLESLVGDVGRNHTLPQPRHSSSTQSSPGKKRTNLFFGATAVVHPSPTVVSTDLPPIKAQEPLLDVEGNADIPNQSPTNDVLQTPTSHSQSIVLLEEVDVVFADDGGFWPAVIAFIKQCKRPVVMTCNDVSLVPTADLPLQETLVFNPLPGLLATSLSRELCLTEGRATVPQAQIVSSNVVDLRQHLNQCQFGITTYGGGIFERPLDSDPEIHAGADADMEQSTDVDSCRGTSAEAWRSFQTQARNADSVSYLDIHLLLSPPFNFELASVHPDDEIGHTAVHATSRLSLPVVAEHYTQDMQMAQAMLQCLRTGMPARRFGGADETDTRLYQSRLQEGLLGLVAEQTMALDSPALHLEYGPWLRQMVEVQEEERERQVASTQGRGRLTSNSQRRQLDASVGWLGVSGGQVSALRGTALCGW